MVYYTQDMELEVISQVFHGSVNDVAVCRDRLSASGTLYTLLVIHDRKCVCEMLKIMEESQRTGECPCLLNFSQNETMLFLFPYREERKFSAFAAGQMTSPEAGESICINLVMECLSNGLPWPLLYLVLEQDCVQIAKDNTIYFTFILDLKDLEPERTEKNCVSSCARLLLALLLAAMLAVASVMPWGLPDSEKMVPGPTEWENGSVLVAENRWFTSRIYTLWEDNVTEIYEESRIRDGEESCIVRAVAVEGGAYFIRALDDGADWELVKLENGKVEQLHRGAFENNEKVTGLQIKEDSCWITGVGENKAIFIYEYTETNGVNLRLIIPAWWVREVESAEYDGTVIRVKYEGSTGEWRRVGGDVLRLLQNARL